MKKNVRKKDIAKDSDQKMFQSFLKFSYAKKTDFFFPDFVIPFERSKNYREELKRSSWGQRGTTFQKPNSEKNFFFLNWSRLQNK